MRAPVEMYGFEYYLQDNWDGDGANAVSPLTYHNMKVILAALPDVLFGGSTMTGAADGSISVYWSFRNPNPNHNNICLYLDLRGNGCMMYYFRDEYDDMVEAVLPAGFTIDHLLECIEPALRQFASIYPHAR